MPSYRLSDKFAITYSAVDYAGSLYVNRFIYLRYRCIYLDLVPDCSSSSCVRILKRLFAARGVPMLIISDNGSQFIFNKTQSFVYSRATKWQFNLPSVPLWGGIFERMIRSMKRCLRQSRVDYKQLHTLLAEIQTIINNKPLTFLYYEPTEKVLTPGHLLFGRKINLENISKSISFNNEDLNKRSQHFHNLLEHFRNRWRTEYLTEL